MKKRLIFTLLYNEGVFCLSRNFRLQSVGDIEWLLNYCNFERMLFALDELCVLDCSRKHTVERHSFYACIEKLNRLCYAPMSVGGWIRSKSEASRAFDCGADKIVLNTSFYDQPDLVNDLVSTYGGQSVVISLDIGKNGILYKSHGQVATHLTLSQAMKQTQALSVGEILINSIEKDGTGQGLDLDLIRLVSQEAQQPVIFTGGVGKPEHFVEGFMQAGAMGLATSNLLNFVGDSILKTREYLHSRDVDLPVWLPPTL